MQAIEAINQLADVMNSKDEYVLTVSIAKALDMIAKVERMTLVEDRKGKGIVQRYQAVAGGYALDIEVDRIAEFAWVKIIPADEAHTAAAAAAADDFQVVVEDSDEDEDEGDAPRAVFVGRVVAAGPRNGALVMFLVSRDGGVTIAHQTPSGGWSLKKTRRALLDGYCVVERRANASERDLMRTMCAQLRDKRQPSAYQVREAKIKARGSKYNFEQHGRSYRAG